MNKSTKIVFGLFVVSLLYIFGTIVALRVTTDRVIERHRVALMGPYPHEKFLKLDKEGQRFFLKHGLKVKLAPPKTSPEQ